ncbi:RCC1/BLIP-II protein [Hesseltinella vesiculosa]|uniref:RCC1/BLIP-II protein n=1 Tax=Hesseltinella vesiculosa TaxID=101127 RepID=A0A1X2GV93_9FUNG|nr:RCC1/BLIP-II protein [Hesseltinella vesiculosa]
MATTLDTLPVDVLLDNILGYLDAESLIQLSYTNRMFSSLCQDEYLWRHLVLEDYSLPRDASFRQMGWKSLYSKLDHSKVYVWGENSDGRLGFEAPNLGRRRFFNSVSVSTPHQLSTLNSKKIVDINAGGWSFHALDKGGQVWAWGKIGGQQMWSTFGSEKLREPTRVALPAATRVISVSCGRGHAVALARDGTVWQWNNVRLAEKVHLPQAYASDPIVQVSANWGASSLLTKSGLLLVIPLPDRVVPNRADEDEEQGPTSGGVRYLKSFPGQRSLSQDNTYTDLHLQESDMSMVSLDRIEHDRLLVSTANYNPVAKEDVLIQIAGTEHCTLALSRAGRVYRFTVQDFEALRASPANSTIEYIHYSAKEQETNVRAAPNRFITANFHQFAVYTRDGPALVGNDTDPFDQRPDNLPVPDVCKVSFGDYHCGALTNDGKLFTWGGFSAGALGHGELYEDGLATPMLLDFFNDQYVFAIGFGGWHSAVLTIPK